MFKETGTRLYKFPRFGGGEIAIGGGAESYTLCIERFSKIFRAKFWHSHMPLNTTHQIIMCFHRPSPTCRPSWDPATLYFSNCFNCQYCNWCIFHVQYIMWKLVAFLYLIFLNSQGRVTKLAKKWSAEIKPHTFARCKILIHFITNILICAMCPSEHVVPPQTF